MTHLSTELETRVRASADQRGYRPTVVLYCSAVFLSILLRLWTVGMNLIVPKESRSRRDEHCIR